MALQLGTRLGPYEIQFAIGAGGMGEVYRATDTNLGRQVAIKVLPDTFAHDPDRLARFERKAKTLASLNHPNIAQIYGLEKADPSAGSGQAGIRALIMELVEGPTLADRIAQAPIPVDEALPIAKQIAEALEAAHEQGIIHRDLKPANVKVRPDGTVKVLDFGLAKALDSSPAAIDASHSPTITSPAMMTGVGVLLGTAASIPLQIPIRCGPRTANVSFLARHARDRTTSTGRWPTARARRSASPTVATSSSRIRSRRTGPRSCFEKRGASASPRVI